ncbi:MAG: dynamin family protein [Campylobacter sp.]
MEILNFAKTLREIATKYDINVVDANMPDEGTLAKQIDDMNDENRLLKIGIIGRVKSGKSSLINALVFNGRDILPKAATPMTAALTVLEYGENLAGEVEFYTDEDLKKIKDKFDSYQRQLKEQTNKEFENLKAQSKIPNLSASKLDELKIKAEQIVINKLKENISLSGAADQWERIEKSGIKLDDLKDNGKIVAKNIDELNRKLYDFVGANGKYMPFTKSVKLTLNEPNLKDINIVDTPGVNDPIPSREERTKALLATCDVVLIVSPAGQFLSEQDTKLLHRVNTKDGIKEIYLIASQADTQIFSDEKDKANGNLHDALTNIIRTLSKTQRNVLKDYKLDNPFIKNALDDLIDNDVILSSSVAFTLLQNWDKKSSWDENSVHVWKNLQKHYNAYFADENSAKANLEKLAGISAVKEILSEVRTRKDEIKAQKTAEFNQVEMKKLLDFKTSAINFINEDIERIKNTDLDKLQSDIAKMKTNKSLAIMAVNDAWDDMVIDLGLHIKEVIYNEIERHFKDLSGEINSSKRTISQTRSYEVEVKANNLFNLFGLLGDRYKTETRYKTNNYADCKRI